MAIKFIQPTEVIKVVSMSDEAIDKEKSNLAEYQIDYDIKHLVFVENLKPTYFVISNLKSTDLVQIQAEHFIAEMPKATPGMSLEDLKKMKVQIKPVKQGEMLVKYFKGGCKKIIDDGKEIEVTDDFTDTVPPMVIQEIGSLVMSRALLSDSKKKS